MHPILSSRLAAPIALFSLVCGAVALLVNIGASPKVAARAASSIDQYERVVDLSAADVEEPQSTATGTKGDRLPLPALSPAQPPSPPDQPAALKPAEAFDYAQAEAEHVRHAYAEASDLCQRHGMHKHYFNVGRRQSWRCER